MRPALVFVVAAAACELRPAPPPAPRATHDAGPPLDAAPARADTGPAPLAGARFDGAPAPPDAAPPDAALAIGSDVSPECITTAKAIAAIVISAADPGVRGNYERARADMVRIVAQACTDQAWSGDKQSCFRSATLEADIRACEDKFPKPR